MQAQTLETQEKLHHDDHLTQLLEQFFLAETQRENLLIDNYFILNEQGRILLSHCTLCDSTTLGVLVSAMLSAQKSLITHCFPHTIQDTLKDQFHRPINLGNSTQGLVVIPFYMNEFPYFIGHQYKDILNPGYVRFQLHSIAKNLEKYLAESTFTPLEKTIESTTPLFPHLSDAEVDKLFHKNENTISKGPQCVDG